MSIKFSLGSDGTVNMLVFPPVVLHAPPPLVICPTATSTLYNIYYTVPLN